MEYNKIEMIDPSNDSLKYIIKRIKDENYRGTISSQHNRYDLKFISTMINIMLKYAPPGKAPIEIRTTDISRRPYNFHSEKKYAEMVNEINEKLGRTTQDSLRKNFFPDFHRMGLIKRYGVDKKELDPFRRSKVKYFKVSELGNKFSKSNELDKNIIFSKSLDFLLKGYLSNIKNLLIFEKFDLDYIDKYEILFFVSAINEKSDFSISLARAAYLIKSFRRLSKFQIKALLSLMRKELDPKKHKGKSKKMKRDWNNWNNKVDQIIVLLKESIYFEYRNGKIYMKGIEVPGEKKLLSKSRSIVQQEKYFSEHKISRTDYKGWELHHIIEFSEAESLAELKLIDNWKNLIFIDAQSHSEITVDRNNYHYYLFDYSDKCIKLSDIIKNKAFIKLEYEKNVSFNREFLEAYKTYNYKILNMQ